MYYFFIIALYFVFQSQPPKKGYHRSTDEGKFGFFFDIDGVFLRGKNILPEARSAFELMLDRRQKWKVPAVFVTNAGGMLKRDKAEQLSELFGVKVDQSPYFLNYKFIFKTGITCFIHHSCDCILACSYCVIFSALK